MPAFAQLHGAARRAIVRYVMSGESETVRADQPSPFDLKYSLDGNARFTDPDGFPAVTPPWGTLTAIDMNKASIAWQVPLGEMPGSGADGFGERELRRSGCDRQRTAVHRGHQLRQQVPRVRRAQGRLLWETTLPAAGNATPAVYDVNGRQFVVIGAGGGKWGAAVRRHVCRVLACRDVAHCKQSRIEK